MEQIRSNAQLCAYVERGLHVEMVQFWGHRPARDGAVSKACFSQWFEAAFAVDGVVYPTAEHFMMAGKARLFGDEAALAKALAAATPGAAKAAGREVRGYQDDVWLAHRFDIVVRANLGKFGQNPALRDFLLATGEQVLVEASPVDAIWGTGLAADDPRAGKPHEWPGLNLLGYALMEVRARLSETGAQAPVAAP